MEKKLIQKVAWDLMKAKCSTPTEQAEGKALRRTEKPAGIVSSSVWHLNICFLLFQNQFGDQYYTNYTFRSLL